MTPTIVEREARQGRQGVEANRAWVKSLLRPDLDYTWSPVPETLYIGQYVEARSEENTRRTPC